MLLYFLSWRLIPSVTWISEVAYIEKEPNPLVRMMEYYLRLITEATWTLSGID